MKRYSLVLVVLLFVMQAFAQKGSIKGRVYDAKTNQALEFASILVQGTSIGSTSDLDGNYIFTGIEPGFKRLVISLVGYQTTVSAEIQVQGNQTTFIDIPVVETAVQLKEVTVRQNQVLKKIESPLSSLTIGVQ